jgi:hypothetical protein
MYDYKVQTKSNMVAHWDWATGQSWAFQSNLLGPVDISFLPAHLAIVD